MASCGPQSQPPAGAGASPHDPDRTVSVLYAGSLTGIQERAVGPAFGAATGLGYRGEGRGSVAAALAMRDRLRAPDVFVTADPSVLEAELMGAAKGNLVEWYVTFASTRMVIAYTARGRFARELDDAKAGRVPWHEVLATPGFRFGRTDPNLDPKGYRILMAVELAEGVTGLPGLRTRLLGDAVNPGQIFPEEQLLTLLEAGQLDAVAAYAIEAAERNLPWVELPAAINLGDPARAATYQRATFTQRDGTVRRGTPILYAATIPRNAPNRGGGIAFIEFLLSPQGRALQRERGLDPAPVLLGGDGDALPPELSRLVEGRYLP